MSNYGLVPGSHDLHMLANLPAADESAAHDINDAGQVVGQIGEVGPFTNGHAALWRLANGGATVCDLGPIFSGTWAIAYAINDDDPPVVVGDAERGEPPCSTAPNGFRATVDVPQCNVLSADRLVPVGADNASATRDVNKRTNPQDEPQIAGFSWRGDFDLCTNGGPGCEPSRDALEWEYPDITVLLHPQQLGGAEARGNNDEGASVGWAFEPTDFPCVRRALFWPGGSADGETLLADNPQDYARAEAINDLSLPQVVGVNTTTIDGLVWQRQAPPSTDWDVTNLNTVILHCSNEFEIERGDDINNDGWIIAVADANPGGGTDFHAVLLTPLAQCPPDTCDADLNGDGGVGILDLLTLLTAWGPCPDLPESCFADLNCDGSVGILDLLELLANWGPCASSIGEVPRTVEDCLNKFCCEEENLLALEKCLCAIEPQNCQ